MLEMVEYTEDNVNWRTHSVTESLYCSSTKCSLGLKGQRGFSVLMPVSQACADTGTSCSFQSTHLGWLFT